MKNGFTLIELLAVMVVIGIIAAITIPVIDNVVEGSRVKAHEEQVKMIEKRAEDYINTHINLLGDEAIYVSVDTLIEEGYFDQDELIDPLTNKKMTGCVKVSYAGIYDKYSYIYGNVCE